MHRRSPAGGLRLGTARRQREAASLPTRRVGCGRAVPPILGRAGPPASRRRSEDPDMPPDAGGILHRTGHARVGRTLGPHPKLHRKSRDRESGHQGLSDRLHDQHRPVGGTSRIDRTPDDAQPGARFRTIQTTTSTASLDHVETRFASEATHGAERRVTSPRIRYSGAHRAKTTRPDQARRNPADAPKAGRQAGSGPKPHQKGRGAIR